MQARRTAERRGRSHRLECQQKSGVRAGHDFPDHRRLVNIAPPRPTQRRQREDLLRRASRGRLTLRRRWPDGAMLTVRSHFSAHRRTGRPERARGMSLRRGPTFCPEKSMTGTCAPGFATQGLHQWLMGEQIGAGAIGRIVGHDAVVQGPSFANDSVDLFGPQEPARGDALRGGPKLGFIIVVARVALSK